MNNTLQEMIQDYLAETITNRRYLHENPELSFQEVNTAAWIRRKLEEYHIETLSGFSGNSTVACIKGNADGPTIAFRADIDALPVEEETGLPYRSLNPGIMHACGHDAHTAVLLTMAKFFADHRDMVRGTVKFIFQQAEEALPGGAKTLCEEGVMDDVDQIFTWHVSSTDPLGTAFLVKGNATAAVGTYEAVITGKGGHGGHPHLSNNPIVCSSAIVQAITQLPALKAPAMDTAVVTVGYLISGTKGVGAANTIPGTATLGGNIRCLNNDLQETMYSQVEAAIKGLAAAYGCECSVTIEKGYPSLVNAEKPRRAMEAAIKDMGLEIYSDRPSMAAEDFSYYTLKKPACFAMVGCYNPDSGQPPMPHHNGKFIIDDEKGIPIALELMLRCYQHAVEEY